MSLEVIDNNLLKKMIMNGAINLRNQHKEIDQLNVFPVPDGDTGTNMQMTMMAGVKEMSNCQSSSIVDSAKALSRGLLMGARGNSGVILSQFFRGVYVGMKDIKENFLTVNDLMKCLISGYEVAYKAVMEPVEGTILTVVREAAELLKKQIKKIKDIASLLKEYLTFSKKSLDNTPNLLPVLKDAGVVDSGGAGFVKVVEGMLMALEGNMLESDIKSVDHAVATNYSEVDIKFAYCTEFIINLKNQNSFSESDLKSPLSIIGDSLVVVKDEDLCKIHIHTNNPGQVLELAQKYGDFATIKIENMKIQHSEIAHALPVASKPKKIGIIAVCFGDGIKETFKELGVDYIIDGGQTMNPPTEEFVKAVNAVNAENIIIIPNNSNVILSAEQAVKLCEDKAIAVLKTKTISQGYASLMVFDSNSDLESNVEEMMEAISNTNTGELTYAVRDTEINGIKIKSGDHMGIFNGQIVVSTKSRLEAGKKLLDSCINQDSSIVTIFYGKDADIKEVNALKSYCEKTNKDLEVEIINGMQDIYSYVISVE
ncbi:MAG: DAK2 domain-containing protein [Anaeroplasmataceae bacterium]